MHNLLRKVRFALPLLCAIAAAGGVAACSSSEADSEDANAALEREELREVNLSDRERTQIVEKKATCPFVGVAIAMRKLVVLGSAANPLARITGAGSVAELGDTGSGSNLGSAVLTLFARGNHHFMLGENGKLDREVPNDTFSLAFPGSQGSHPGHSGILQGNPSVLDSGAFSAKHFQRLVAVKNEGGDRCLPVGHAERLAEGSLVVRRSEIGKFIAENLRADSASKVAGLRVFAKLGLDTVDVGRAIGGLAVGGDSDRVFVSLTKLLGEDNLVGSAGEFGLLMAFLANSPKTVELDGEPAIAVADLMELFAPDPAARRFPSGWETWPKTRHSWMKNTLSLTHSAALEHARLGTFCK